MNLMPRELPDVGPLPVLYETLHRSEEVLWATAQSSEPLPNDRIAPIANYLAMLAGRHGLLGGDEARKAAQIAGTVGDHHNQALAQGLETWTDYINSDDANYPVWYRYLAMRSITKMGSFDRQRSRFKTRSKSTRDPYPELNPEALALVYTQLNQGTVAGFNSMYSGAIVELEATSKERGLGSNEGAWKKFDQEPEGADQNSKTLSDSLQGYNTSWCTAIGHASWQLARGDFYVFYTEDAEGKYCIPRLAIRMGGEHIAEIRGVDTSSYQGIEAELYDTVFEQLDAMELSPEDTERLTRLRSGLELASRITEGQLSSEDLKSLYSTYPPDNHRYHSFGFPGFSVGSNELRKALDGRSFMPDMEFVFETANQKVISRLLANENPELLKHNLHSFEGIDIEIFHSLPLSTMDCLKVTVNTFDLSGDHTNICQRLLEMDQETLFYKLLSYMQDINPAALDGLDFNTKRAGAELGSFKITELEPVLPLIGAPTSNSDIIKLLKQFPDAESHQAIINTLFEDNSGDDGCRRVFNLLEYVNSRAWDTVLDTLVETSRSGRLLLHLLKELPESYHGRLVTKLYNNETVGLKWILSNIESLDTANQVHLAKLAVGEGRTKRVIKAFSNFSPDAQEAIARHVVEKHGNGAILARLRRASNANWKATVSRVL